MKKLKKIGNWGKKEVKRALLSEPEVLPVTSIDNLFDTLRIQELVLEHLEAS